jgi:hypothetical protein
MTKLEHLLLKHKVEVDFKKVQELELIKAKFQQVILSCQFI